MAEQNVEDNVVRQDATSEIMFDCMTYGEEVMLTKVINAVDGLKNIFRRVVWFTQDYKSATALGRLIGELLEHHTSGDKSIDEVFIRLSQVFSVGHPLIAIAGNHGSYYDPRGAQFRYLSACLSDFARDLYYRDISLATIPMTAGKTINVLEPLFMIPKLPMALVLGNLTVGYGFKSKIPMMDFPDVCDLVRIYAQHHKSKDLTRLPHKVFAPYCVPKFPILNLIKNRKQLIQAYSVGDYDHPIALDGWIDIAGDRVTLRAVPYGASYLKAVEVIRETMIKNNKHWLFDYIDSANDHSDKEARLTLNMRRGRNPFELVNRLKPLIKFSINMQPIRNYVLYGKIANLTPENILDVWYQERAGSIKNSLKVAQAKLVFERMKLEAMLLVVDSAKEVIEIIEKSSGDDAETAMRLHTKFPGLTKRQLEIVANLPLKTLAKARKPQLESDMDDVDEALKEIASQFSEVDTTIEEDAIYLKKKYPSTSLTRFSDEFIGYVKFGNWGITNFFDMEDMRNILNTRGWPSDMEKTVHMYDPRSPRLCLVQHGRMQEVTEMPRNLQCEQILQYPAARSDEITLVINHKTKSVSVVEKLVCLDDDDYTLCPISKKFFAIHRNGVITEELYSNFSIRKSISSGAKSDVIFGLPDKMSDVVLVHMNTTEPNTVNFTRILTSDGLGKVRTVASGRQMILGAFPLKQKTVVLNIPSNCRKSCAAEVMFVENMSNMFTDSHSSNITVNLGRTTTDVGKLKRDTVVRTMFTLTVPEADSDK